MDPLTLGILTKLAQSGLELVGSAILSKGKDVVEKTLGVSIDDSLATPEGTEKLKQIAMEHEEMLLQMALENRKLDQNYFKLETDDADSARKREVAIVEAENAGWLNKNLVPILALVVILGGGVLLVYTRETDLRIAVVGMMTMVLGYYFGKSSSEWRKDSTISKLTDKV